MRDLIPFGSKRSFLPLVAVRSEPTVVGLAWAHGVPVLEAGRLAHPQTLTALYDPRPDVLCVACFPRLLPPELLTRPWPGRGARDLVVTCRRLALSLRQSAGRPALFRLFDDAIDQLPFRV